MGLGGVGLSAMLGAKASGARQIIGIDPVKYKRDGAKQLGADLVLDPADRNVVEKLGDATSGGLDYVFFEVGEVEAIQLAYAVTGRGGTTIKDYLIPPKIFQLVMYNLLVEERTIKGSFWAAVFQKEIYLII